MGMPKRDMFEGVIASLREKFPNVYAILFISMEGFPIHAWGLDFDDSENVSAMLSALVGKASDIVKNIRENGLMNFIHLDTNFGEIRIAPQEEFILVTIVK